MTISVGSFRIDPVYEQDLHDVTTVVTEAQPEALKQISWMAPPFVNDDNVPLGIVQAFLVRAGDYTVLIDPCVGDDKDIPVVESWNKAKTGFLDRFRATGFNPADVDVVLSTHLHLDHIGWATHLTPEGWVPTFPNARHIFIGDEVRFWEGVSNTTVELPPSDAPMIEQLMALFQQTQINVYEESVRPLHEAGLIEIAEEYGEVIPGITLVSTPGHTPGHTSVRIESDGETVFITGDAFHHPAQVAHPEWAASTDDNSEQSVATRKHLLAELADTPTLVIGNHFAAPSIGRIVSDDSGGYKFNPVN